MHRLKKIIQALGLTQKEFAEGIDISANALSELFSGRSRGLSEKSLASIAQKYRVNLHWLLLGKGEMFLPDLTEECHGASTVAEKNETYHRKTAAPSDKTSNKIIDSPEWMNSLSDTKQFIIQAILNLDDREFLEILKEHIDLWIAKEKKT